MIYVVGSEYKELRKEIAFRHKDDHTWSTPWWGSSDRNVVGIYRGEEVFLCPYLSIDRERGICDTCKYRFECFTNKWGFKDTKFIGGNGSIV